MKKIIVNDQEFQAEKIIKSTNSILGQDLQGNEVFTFRGISDFSIFTIEDENGNISDFINLDMIKQDKMNELSDRCNEVITKEFYSDADGTKRNYGLELENQIRIKSMADDIELAQLKGQTIDNVPYYAQGESPCREYTPEQFLKLANDAKSWVFINVNKYKDKLKPIVDNCTTIEEVSSITFDMEIS